MYSIVCIDTNDAATCIFYILWVFVIFSFVSKKNRTAAEPLPNCGPLPLTAMVLCKREMMCIVSYPKISMYSAVVDIYHGR